MSSPSRSAPGSTCTVAVVASPDTPALQVCRTGSQGGDALAAAELEAQGAALGLVRAGEDALLGVGRRVLGDEVEPGALSHARGRRAPDAEAARGRDREGSGRERVARALDAHAVGPDREVVRDVVTRPVLAVVLAPDEGPPEVGVGDRPAAVGLLPLQEQERVVHRPVAAEGAAAPDDLEGPHALDHVRAGDERADDPAVACGRRPRRGAPCGRHGRRGRRGRAAGHSRDEIAQALHHEVLRLGDGRDSDRNRSLVS